MSDLIQEFPGNKLKEWEEWYLNKHPESLSLAAIKIFEKDGIRISFDEDVL